MALDINGLYTNPLERARQLAKEVNKASSVVDSASGIKRLTSLRTPSLSSGILATFRANIVTAGDTLPNSEMNALRDPLERLIRTTAWPKIKELWVPCGTSAITGALVKLKWDATSTSTMTHTALVAGDYSSSTTATSTGGITGNGSSKTINTGFNPTTAGVTANSWGFAAYPTANTNNGILAGIVSGGGNYVSFPGNSDSRINGVSSVAAGSGILQFQYPRMNFVQVGGTTPVVSSGYNGYTYTSNAYTSGTVPNSNLALLSSGGANFSTQTLSGYAAWSPALTNAELRELGLFFDTVNDTLGRTAFRPVLTAVGDSNTRGYDPTNPGVVKVARWTTQLTGLLGITDQNQGVDDTTMSDNYLITPTGNWVSGTRIQRTTRWQPTLITIMLGTNDERYGVSPADYESDYEAFLNQQFSAGFDPSQVILMSQVASFDVTSNLARQYIFKAIVKKLALKYGCGYVDIHALTLNRPDLFFSDQLHINPAGDTVVANAVFNYIASQSTSNSLVYSPVNYTIL